MRALLQFDDPRETIPCGFKEVRTHRMFVSTSIKHDEILSNLHYYFRTINSGVKNRNSRTTKPRNWTEECDVRTCDDDFLTRLPNIILVGYHGELFLPQLRCPGRAENVLNILTLIKRS